MNKVDPSWLRTPSRSRAASTSRDPASPCEVRLRRAFWPSPCLVITLRPVTGLTRSPRLVGAVGSILLWLTAGAILALWFTRRIRDWSVMTDELQYVKLALSVAETHSPLPAIHGASVAASNQLYPLLLAPAVSQSRIDPTAETSRGERVRPVTGCRVVASPAGRDSLIVRYGPSRASFE